MLEATTVNKIKIKIVGTAAEVFPLWQSEYFVYMLQSIR